MKRVCTRTAAALLSAAAVGSLYLSVAPVTSAAENPGYKCQLVYRPDPSGGLLYGHHCVAQGGAPDAGSKSGNITITDVLNSSKEGAFICGEVYVDTGDLVGRRCYLKDQSDDSR
ncbi:hypothetical protein [Nocardia sp. NPDC057030]|uniref:hypothetical protein n=1 Tax=unclassified Nocardia TaxID=2637762 RepID=UPI00362AC9CD